MSLRRLLLACLLLLLAGCASIPAEAPELSVELGKRLDAIEAAHRALLTAYFDEKRARVEDFLQKEWIPRFAEHYFQQPQASALWLQVVLQGDEEDRLRYLLTVGPEVVAAIDRQRRDMMASLELLEREIGAVLAEEYDTARAVNRTLTTFLLSASELERVRGRFLERFDLTDDRLAGWLDDADEAVGRLVERKEQVEAWRDKAESYRGEMEDLLDRIRAEFSGREEP